MCTAITYKTRDFYFGRNLDLEYHYNESVVITPRNYAFTLRSGDVISRHHAIIGIATMSDNFPLYYEAVNEKGLCIAGLNFPKNAMYLPYAEEKINITPFELIPYILGKFETVDEAVSELCKINLLNEPFSDRFPLSPLHWLLSDKHRSVTLEPTADGLRIYENPVGVLTNNPPFEYHMHNLANYMNLTSCPPENRFSEEINLSPYSLGMGAIGLPGDLSSASRFVRAAFIKLNSVSEDDEASSVSHLFHILGSVAQQRGATVVRKGEYEYTLYSSCCNANRGIYYYTTYTNSCITSVSMHSENLDGDLPISYPLATEQVIIRQN